MHTAWLFFTARNPSSRQVKWARNITTACQLSALPHKPPLYPLCSDAWLGGVCVWFYVCVSELNMEGRKRVRKITSSPTCFLITESPYGTRYDLFSSEHPSFSLLWIHNELWRGGSDAVHLRSHLDGQHHVCVALQHLHGATVADVLKAHSVGSQDLVPHLDSILLSQTTGIQSDTNETAAP